ncbi:MAG TPA: PRTRC system protein B [Candidatus Sulfotelmatobacter sp.]|nr:PRTRC system protein B [Candidatus Sulfotelmatobacter sp.]
MDAHVRIGNNRIFTLKQAVLVYQEGTRAFATLHEVKQRPDRASYLCAGQSVTIGFLESLAKSLGASMAAEVLPDHVLARTPDLIAWWTQAKTRLMFFGDGDTKARNLNGKMYPHPALVFMIQGRELFVRALAENCRPKSDTYLKNAPYWNTDAQGRVCLGSMRVPGEVSASSLRGWEEAYFASEFTHPSGAVRLTTHPGGFLGLWLSLVGGKQRFPLRFLADSRQTLQQFIE